MYRRKWSLLIFLPMLTACQEPEPLEPVRLNTELMESYELSCKSCHQLPGHPAPQAHDIENWSELMRKGLDKLVDNSLNGTGAMPPLGQCFECTKADLEQLILYMASPATKAEPGQND